MKAAAFNEQVRNYMHEINFKIMQMMNQNLVPFGITPSQMSIIVNLDKHGEMNISELSKMVRTPKSNISAICGRLEDNGLLIRRRDQTDQRIVYVALSEKAITLAHAVRDSMDHLQNQLASRLTQQEREDVLKGLSILKRMYEESPFSEPKQS
ncbi:MAG: MarR family transcriptional regulator [Clostridiales bacterium]|nr:MarR family transcriptional regulator [Clostridiales bacterium]